MSDDSIPKKVIQQLEQIGTETMEKAVDSAGKIVYETISPKDLLGLEPMNAGDYSQKKTDDEAYKQKKMDELKQQIPGRNAVPAGRQVEAEIKQVRDEKKQKEEEEERVMLENVKRQREEEEAERAQMVQEPGNAKREQARAQMQPHGKKKSQQPDPSQMSQTAEFKGKID